MQQPSSSAPPRFRVADVVRLHGDDFVAREDIVITPIQRRTLDAIVRCRTAAMGAHAAVYSCGHEVIAYNSCRHRGCTRCGRHVAAQWVEAREQELLPVPYFHIVFTLPPALRDVPMVARWQVYEALFQASSSTLARFARERLHGEPGVISVLHTWGQTLTHHPHVHCVVAGGAWDANRAAFIRPRHTRFLFPVRALSKVFRGKMIDELRRRGLPGVSSDELEAIIAKAYSSPWVVYAKPPFGGPLQVLRYLARYIHRVAIGDSRLVNVDDDGVTFTYKDYKDSGREKRMTLSGHEWLRRFVQHLPPRRFVRIRSTGFLANTTKQAKLTAIREAIGATAPKPSSTTPKPMVCPHCGAARVSLIELLPRQPSCTAIRRLDSS